MDDQTYFDAEILGDDLLVEILSKLPIKYILRVRSVSKHWCYLTKTDYFIAKQCQCQDPAIIFRHLGNCNEFGLLSGSGNEEMVSSSFKLPVFPFITEVDRIKFIGSSRGLVSMAVCFQIHPNEKGVLQQVIIVWNPATQQYRILPQPDTWFSSDDIIYTNGRFANHWKIPIIGFCFVHEEDRMISSNDYKLARIFCQDDATDLSYVFRAQVLDQSKDSWKMVKNELRLAPCEILDSSASLITLNGVIYWTMILRTGKYSDDSECCVMSFDLNKEVFNVIDIPADLRRHSHYNPLRLLSWQNSLAIFSLRHAMLWVMDTSNNRPIWTQKFIFKQDIFRGTWYNSWCGFLTDDQFLFQIFTHSTDASDSNEINLISYDPNTDTKYIINHRKRADSIQKALNYIATLVPV